jgi:hypothetical protein
MDEFAEGPPEDQEGASQHGLQYVLTCRLSVLMLKPNEAWGRYERSFGIRRRWQRELPVDIPFAG